MRVLHLGKYYPPVPGGIETHVRELCAGLAPNTEVTCAVSASGQEGSCGKDGHVTVLKFGKLFRGLPPLNPALPAWFCRNRGRFDVVHVHAPNPWAELCCLLFPPKRLVVSYHADIVGKALAPLYLPLQKLLLKRADAIITGSRALVSSSAMLRPFARKCTVIPYSVDGARFKKIDKAAIARLRALGKPPYFLCVGRLVPYKGLNVLVNAMRSVQGTLFVVGVGPLLQDLRAQASAAGIAEHVHFFPKVPDDALPDFFHAADVFVLPSVTRAESFGIVQLEAMACGKPVISTRLGTGVEEVNVHGTTGLTVLPRDAVALAEAMRTLAERPAVRARLGVQARKRAQQYSSHAMTDAVLALYLRVCERKADKAVAEVDTYA